ncbi:MAG: alpha/beta fold hydrolase [Bacteriovoracaceae bacterium]
MRPLCVLLHGYPNNSTIWKEQLPLLEKRFDILNLSLPGSEDGKVNQEELKLERLVALYKEKILSAGNEKIILVGHDIGAFVLSEVSRALGEKVIARVYMGGMDFRLFSHRLKTSDQKFRSWYVALFQTPILPELIIPRMKKLLSLKLYRDTPELLAEAPHGFTPVGIYRELIAGIKRSRDEKGQISGRTLFLFGDRDPYIGAPLSEDIGKYYESAELKVLSGGHWFMRETPHKTNILLEDFINRSV